MKEKAKRLGTILFPVILFLYPLLKITQGIELTDTCYGLVNYRFFPHAGQEWTVATYLANVLGALLMRLPFGDSLVGMRFYTGLFVSAHSTMLGRRVSTEAPRHTPANAIHLRFCQISPRYKSTVPHKNRKNVR